MAKKVLVTGASGLIGRELCKQLLAQDYYVVAIDNNFRYNYVPTCDCYYVCDVHEYCSISDNDFDYIFHMGNINGTKYFYDISNELIENNITSDFAIFNFVKKNSNCKLIYASSSEVIADTQNYPTSEELDITIKDIHNPRWSYRLGKIVGENYLKNSNIDYVIVRFFNVYSEYSGKGHFVKDIADKVKAGNFELIGADETRSFCYVADAADAVIHIKDISKKVINIGSDEEITILDAANIIADSLGFNKIKWIFKEGLRGSVKRRNPDISLLKTYYSEFRPKSFKNVLKQIKLV